MQLSKTSEAYWTKDIPEKWKVDRLRDIAIINYDTLPSDTSSNFQLRYLDISNVNYHGVISFDAVEIMYFEDAPSRARRIVKKFDTIISSVRPNLQALCYINFDDSNLICSTGFNVVRPRNNSIDSRYLFYFLISESAKEFFVARAKGVGYPAIGDYDFGSLPVSFPHLIAQTAIASYLDDATAKIDKVIAAKKLQLEKLEQYRKLKINEVMTKGLEANTPMKVSGIAWIGDVPSNWSVEKLKHSVEVKDGTHDTPNYEETSEGNFPFVTSKDISENSIDFSSTKYVNVTYYNSYDQRSNVRRNDIIMPMIGTIGNSAIVETDIKFAIKNVALFKTSESKKVLVNYLFYFLESDFNKMQSQINSKGGVQSFVSLSDLRNMYFIKPPKNVQHAIVTYLDNLSLLIKKEKLIIETQITTLHKYRKSLIYECVTGKRKVIND